MKTRRTLAAVGALAALALCGLASRTTRDQAAAPPATGQPLSSPAPTADPDAAAYGAWLRSTVGPLGASTSDLARLFADASANPALFVDGSWKLQVAGDLAALQLAAGELRSRETPAAAEHLRGRVLAVAASLDSAAGLIARGVDRLDPDTLQAGVQELESTAPHLAALDAELDQLAPLDH